MECTEFPQIDYEMTASQFWSISTLSSRAYQTIKYNCDKAWPPFNFIGWNEHEFEVEEKDQECIQVLLCYLFTSVYKHVICFCFL